MRVIPVFAIAVSLFLSSFTYAQDSVDAVPAASPTPDPTAPLNVSRENRAEAYAKLLEGQRYIWTARKTNSALARRTSTRLAKNALRKAVELNPRLAEAYTALAELSLRGSDLDVEEAISLATIAVKIDPENFGANQYLGRLYTVKSGLGRGRISAEFAAKAISFWKVVGRLDPRNAEAWAFLGEFYRALNDSESRISALRNWLSSADSSDAGFFVTVVRGSEGLTPSLAALPLGEALLEAGKRTEAIAVLSRAVSDNPENLLATDLLGRSLENAETARLKPAIEALQQAVYTNPENVSLIQLLAETHAKAGDLKSASSVIRASLGKLDRRKRAAVLLSLGDIYSEYDQIEEALTTYRAAFVARGLSESTLVGDSDRGFALLVIGKMVQALQRSDRVSDAEKVIEDSKGLFSVDDFVMDREKISLMRTTGRRAEALNLLRSLRQKAPDDYNLLRKEAEILTELGKVDEAAALVVPLIENKSGSEPQSIKYDDFVNRLFIASLYIRADRADEAIFHAEKAFSIANGDQSKQLAALKIASAQRIAGDLGAAEKSLNDILKMTPNNPMALNDLGSLYLRKDTDYSRALDLIERAASIDPRNPVYLNSLGLAHFKLGNLDKAETYLRRSLRYDLSSVTAYERLGDVLLKQGNKVEAQNLWKKALTIAIKGTDVSRIEKKIGL
ncbi:MAG: tetratricopeptide repeat protein [Pyrinomonadaceae bacterium]|nr:tetratricopeptide repeat protein [Pyrinomonadaceae bacterium]